MKTCKMCEETKPLDEFPNGYRKNDGTYSKASKCKPCMKEYTKKYKRKHYEKNIESYKERSRRKREEFPGETKEYQKRYYEANKEELKEKQKAYDNTKKGKESRKKSYDKYRFSEEGKRKEKARSVVNHALRDGKLTKPEVCERCECTSKVEGHHEDYDKPLEVLWLCKQCHEDTHHLNEGHESI